MKNRYFGKQSTSGTGHEFFDVESNFSSAGFILRSLFAILSAVGVLYCSLFYLPAFLDQKGIVRFSSVQKIKPNLQAEQETENWFTPYLDLLRLRRGYFKAGQNVQIQYLLEERANLQIELIRCAGPVFVEIFHCKPVGITQHTQSESVQGEIATTLNQSGFYRMKESVKNNEGELVAHSIIWRRM